MATSSVLPIDPTQVYVKKRRQSLIANIASKFRRISSSTIDPASLAGMRTNKGIKASEAAQWALSFECLLQSKRGLKLFLEFQKSEFSEENVEFWIACEKFSKAKTKKLAQLSQSIFTQFIDIDSPRQVNLDCKTRQAIASSMETPTRDTFRQAQIKIQYLMENDSYKRFLESDVFNTIAKS